MLQRLAESEAGIDQDLLLVDAAELAGEDAIGEEALDLADHIVVTRVLLHRPRLALHVHQADGGTGFGGGLERAGEAQRAHVVD